MKNNAAEYFRSLSPLKAAEGSAGSHESRSHNGRSGRCHCCPYGYHIDLDFVRFCDTLTQGSKNDSPTLRQLKKLKRARRRQTKSMEVLLGLSSGKENEIPDHQSQERLEIIEEPSKGDSLSRKISSKSRRINTWKDKTPPPLPLRQCNTLRKSLHPEATNATHSNSVLNSNSDLNASEALQEAVLDFEEMLENSKEARHHKNRSETLPSDLASYNSSHQSLYSQHYPLSPKLGTGLGRSHSLPRQFLDESSLMIRRQRTNSVSSLCSNSSGAGQSNMMPGGTPTNGGPPGIPGYLPTNHVGVIQQHTVPNRLSEALAALNAAQGYPMGQPDFDAMSVMSGMSGVSTSTLQSIRDQMATSLGRLKDLEDEVKTIPMLQIKLNVLKEEKRLLIQKLKSIQRSDDVTLLLPPSIDGDLSDMSEDELEGRLSNLRSTGRTTTRTRRRRSESPLRVNLEDFHSYRRARRGSVSEGSEADSVNDDVPLFIKEANDHILEKKALKDLSTERRSSLEQAEKRMQSQNDAPESRLSHSMPGTPLPGRRHVRDASTNCRVLTRDIGVTHIGMRTRSVGITTDRVEVDKRKEIKAKPCMNCYERNKKTFDCKSVGTPSGFQKEKGKRLSISNVSLESFDPEDVDNDVKDSLDRDENSKNMFLQKLGRKSAIISRLSEPQLAPPVLTFDNSTNTEHIRQRDQRTFTTLSMNDLYTKADLNDCVSKARKDWEAKRGDLFTKADLTSHLAKAKREWEANQSEFFTKSDLNDRIEKAKREWESKQSEVFTKADLNEHIAKVKQEWESKQSELFTKSELNEYLVKAKQEWESKQSELYTKADLNEQLAKAKQEWKSKQSELFTRTQLDEHVAKSRMEWESKATKDWEAKQDDFYSKVELDEQIAKSRMEWETKAKMDWEAKQNDFYSKVELDEQIAKSRTEWEAKANEDWEVKQNYFYSKVELDEQIAKSRMEWDAKAKRDWEAKQNDFYSKVELDEQIAKSRTEWEAKANEDWEAKQNDFYSKVELDEQIAKAKHQWDAKQAELLATKTVEKPFTSNSGIQVSMDDPSLAKTSFQPLLQSVGVMVQPHYVTVGVGRDRISDNFCDKCANIKTKSVASGDSTVNDVFCDKCVNVKTRSVAIGDFRLTDLWCEKCSALQTRTVGCSSDRISDRICDKCDNICTRSVASGPSLPTEKLVKESLSKTKVNSYVQTSRLETRTASVNTIPLNLKKEEFGGEASGTSSPALTPEVERRSYGSSGVRICDKCHETIQSVAKDIVSTSGTACATNIPPVPSLISKIPRLVDLGKVEPRLDIPVQDLRVGVGRNVSSSLESSLTESQLSSMNNSFLDTKTSTLSSATVKRSASLERRQTKPDLFSNSAHDVLAKKQVHRLSSSSGTTYAESVKTTSENSKAVESKESKGSSSLLKASLGSERTNISNKTAQPTGVTLTSGGSSMSNSPQVKRVPFNRQNTYTKFSEGLVNLGFDENADPQKQKVSSSDGALAEVPQIKETSPGHPPKEEEEEEDDDDEEEKHKSLVSDVEENSEEKSEDSTTKKSSKPEPVIQSKTKTLSSCSSASDSDETCDDASLLEASFSSQPDVASSFQSASSLFTTTSERSRKKSVPSREMKAALKVLNDSIGKPVRSGQQLTNAANIIQREWFKISSQKDANPHAVEDYMDAFEDYSKSLLQRVVNLSDVNGNTAMHYAVSHGNFDVVSILLDSKVCNINQQNKAGYTATMLVSLAQIRSETHASVVQRLFQLGDVNIKASQHGQTALMLAVSHGRLDMVRLLVISGAEINIHDEDGSTALMCSAEHGHLAIVKFLLGHPDTDPTLMDNDGSTALTIAVEAGHKDVGVLLYKHMNLSRGSSPYSSTRVKRSRTPTMNRPAITPPPRSSAPSSPGRSRKSSAPPSPGRSRQSSASLSNLMI